MLAAGGRLVAGAAARRRRAARASTTARCCDHLRTIYDDWVAAGFPVDPGQDRVVPYVFPTAGTARRSAACASRPPCTPGPGGYCYDTMTLVGPGHLGGRARRGRRRAHRGRPGASGGQHRLAYALCRPPGHHAGRDCVRRVVLPQQRGGRRAGAARRPATSGSRSSTSTRTTATAPRRSSTTAATSSTARCTSTPARAGSRTTSGFADETGTGDGRGRDAQRAARSGHRRHRLAGRGSTGCATRSPSIGSDRARRLPRRRRGGRRPREPAAGDRGRLPRGRRACWPRLGLPTVAVQEGGYHLPTLGPLVVATLAGLSG